MRNGFVKFLGLVAILAASLTVKAQEVQRPTYWGVEAGWYFPTSKFVRDNFDNAIFRVGVSSVHSRYVPKWTLSYDFSLIGASDNGNSFLLIPVTVGYTKSLGQPEGDVNPYVRAGVGLDYFNYDIADKSDSGLGFTGVVEVGAYLGHNFQISAKYNLFSKNNGVDLSGMQLAFSYGLFRF